MGGEQERPRVRAEDGAPSLMTSALKAGAAAGAIGFAGGSVAGVLISKPPLNYGILTGIHWSAMGTSFWFVRSVYLSSFAPGQPSRNDVLYGSVTAAAVTGAAVSTAYRGIARMPQGAITFALVGGLGQVGYNLLDRRRTASLEQGPSPPILERLSASKWSPLRTLSNEQYVETLREKVIAIEAEIAIVDDNIKNLKTTLAETSVDNEEKKN